MIAVDEHALICDLAEVYHVYNYRALPLRLAATLAAGLGPDSRIAMSLTGKKLRTDTMLLATIADSLRFIAWSKTTDGQNGRNKPKSILLALTEPKVPDDTVIYDSPEDFEAERARLLGG